MAIICEKREITLNYKKDKPKAYKLATVRHQKVTYEKLLDEVSNSCGVNRSQSKAVVDALVDRMCMFMDFGMPVQLGEFGTFKPTIQSKAKESEDELTTNDVKRLKILYYPGKRFKKMLANLSVTSFSDNDDEEEEETPDNGTGGGNQENGGQDFS